MAHKGSYDEVTAETTKTPEGRAKKIGPVRLKELRLMVFSLKVAALREGLHVSLKPIAPDVVSTYSVEKLKMPTGRTEAYEPWVQRVFDAWTGSWMMASQVIRYSSPFQSLYSFRCCSTNSEKDA